MRSLKCVFKFVTKNSAICLSKGFLFAECSQLHKAFAYLITWNSVPYNKQSIWSKQAGTAWTMRQEGNTTLYASHFRGILLYASIFF